MYQVADKTVSSNICRQIGARGLALMGAHTFVYTDTSLTFRVNGAKHKGLVVVSLNGQDLYTVELLRIRGVDVKTVAVLENIDAENLGRVLVDRVG